jgi:hypothetical protein
MDLTQMYVNELVPWAALDAFVRMISNVQGPSPTSRSVSPLTRLDRGRPTLSGWWAPITDMSLMYL